MVLILALVGVLVGIAVPTLSSALDRIEVRTAANHLTAAHQRARMMAVTRGEVLVLSVHQNELTIRPRGKATPLWTEAGPVANGVALEGAGHTFTFLPEGLTLGLSNASLRLSRGSARQTVIISRLGRVRVAR